MTGRELVPVPTGTHPIQPGLPSVEFDLISRWLISFGSPATRRTYAHCVRLWLAWLHEVDVPLLEATRAVVDGWVRSMELEDPAPAPGTVALRIAAVSSLYEYAIDEAGLTVNPCTRVRRPAVSKDGITPAISADEARKLLAVAERDGPRSVVLVGLLLLGGMRISEALSLDFERLGSERGHTTVRVIGKGGTDHVVPLPPFVVRGIEATDRTTGPLLVDGEGKRMGRGTAAAILGRLGRLAELTLPLAAHQLRCTSITELLRTHPIQDVATFARHAHVTTTARYDRRAKSLDGHLTYSLATTLTPEQEAS